jgi:S-adenosylmethionine:tRNA ribosyltransferase-isomerase
MPFSLSDYDFDLPESQIAQFPATPRDSSRLMVIDRAKGSWEHRTFRDLPELLNSGDVCVANNTRVMKARLPGRRIASDGSEAGKTEFLMLEQLGPRTWEGLFKASAKYVPGVMFEVPTPDGRGLRGRLVRGSAESAHGTVVAEFDRDPVESGAGELPLPHYIKGADAATDATYQTLYAKQAGSAAAPTAGLHFTEAVMSGLRERGVSWEEITLCVGLGTFRPVKTDDIRQHKMHEERFEVDASVAERITEAKTAGRRVLAVGTTSVRTLESAWNEGRARLDSGWGRTSIYIYPGYRFRVVDRLLTNFHLPRSSLLMLVSAFAGHELTLAAYRDAVKEGYRFFSYGDAMVIL